MPNPTPSHPAERRFSRRSRLLSRGHFDRVFKVGRKLVDPRLVIWIAPAPAGASGSRVGFSVSRKVGNAVARNRVKRVLREAWRRCAPSIDPPADMVVLARPAAPPATLAEAQHSLQRLLARWPLAPRLPPRSPAAGAPPGPPDAEP